LPRRKKVEDDLQIPALLPAAALGFSVGIALRAPESAAE
jgi:hypothetical protein